MSKVNSMLTERFKQAKGYPKMAQLAQQSAMGELTSFSGLFSIAKITDDEKVLLKNILEKFSDKEHDLAPDLDALIALTCEVKAINNQAVLLHGERIKKGQTLFKNYREGAFSAWLLATYGNRQTPYNFLQYYEFYEKIPKDLQALVEAMPRQAVYTLASREGPLEKKEEIVKQAAGQSKQELLEQIRSHFPLSIDDKRRARKEEEIFNLFNLLEKKLNQRDLNFSEKEKQTLLKMADKLNRSIHTLS